MGKIRDLALQAPRAPPSDVVALFSELGAEQMVTVTRASKAWQKSLCLHRDDLSGYIVGGDFQADEQFWLLLWARKQPPSRRASSA